MTKTKVSMKLPKVGDHLKRIVTAESDCLWGTFEPKECVVTYVNEPHHWYEVEFIDSHSKECYGLPIIDHSVLNVKPGNVPVMCLETGMVYSSISQCAKDTNLYAGNISRQVLGERRGYFDYHFTSVL